ncbi:MAG: hypothetical protein AAGH88_15735 [Planctomycetota bacterium]
MSWFQKLCRNAGLMVHGIKQPIKQDAEKRGNAKQIVKHEVQQQRIEPNVTLRRTTIEEIEVSPGADSDTLKCVADRPQECDPSGPTK